MTNEPAPAPVPAPAPAPAPVPAPAPAPAPAGDWYAGKITEPDLIGHMQNRGWHNKAPLDVAVEAVRAHREAEKHIGVPVNRLIRLPENMADTEAMKPVWNRLGVPNDPKEYEFKEIKRADGTVVDEGFQNVLRASAAKNNLTKDGAVNVAKDVVAYMDAAKAAEVTAYNDAVAESKAALAKSWGPNFEINKAIATNAAHAMFKAMAVPEDKAKLIISDLEKSAGYAVTMEMFRQIATKIGEDKFITPPGGQPGIMTREQAELRKTELMADKEWQKKYLAGDTQAAKEMRALNLLIAGGDDTEASRR